MVRDWMEGAATTGKAGWLGAAVAGTGVAVFVVAATVGTLVAGRALALAVTAAVAGKVAMVGKAGETVLQAPIARIIATPPSRIFK
jgi:uncharacterized membrane protein